MNRNGLRHEAEARVAQSGASPEIPATDLKNLVFELQVHQEELIVQNEELRRTHLDLQTQKYLYTDLYDFAPVGYLTLESNGLIVGANLMAASMLNRDRANLIETRLASFCSVSSRSTLAIYLDRLVSSNARDSCELELTVAQDGPMHIRLEGKAAPAIDEESSVSIRVVMIDVSERHAAEAAAASREHRLRTITDAVPVLIAYFDVDSRFQFVNAAYEDWFDTTRTSLLNQPANVIFNTTFVDNLDRAKPFLVSGESVDFEVEIEHRVLGQRKLEMKLVPDKSEDGTVQGFHAFGIDATERRVLEDQSTHHRKISDRLRLLTDGERTVYDRLIRGTSNSKIAEEFGIGLRTVERRRQNILKKLDVQSLAEMIHEFTKLTGLK